tara:strand:+ start:85 stop:831 length:747 start_codon:yes stop_codon:yes gene_type:complete
MANNGNNKRVRSEEDDGGQDAKGHRVEGTVEVGPDFDTNATLARLQADTPREIVFKRTGVYTSRGFGNGDEAFEEEIGKLPGVKKLTVDGVCRCFGRDLDDLIPQSAEAARLIGTATPLWTVGNFIEWLGESDGNHPNLRELVIGERGEDVVGAEDVIRAMEKTGSAQKRKLTIRIENVEKDLEEDTMKILTLLYATSKHSAITWEIVMETEMHKPEADRVPIAVPLQVPEGMEDFYEDATDDFEARK